MTPRVTVRRPFSRSGVGVHTGSRCEVVVRPAPFGDGVVFQRHGATSTAVPARIEHAVSDGGATTLGRGSGRFRTVEHLLAALYGAGVTDAIVDLDGPEIPILDGSARPWCDAIDEAGLLAGPPGPTLIVQREVAVEAAGGHARIVPCGRCEVAVTVDFGEGGPRGAAEIALEGRRFAEEVAWARTFVLAGDVARLRDAGRGRGASAANTVLWRTDGSMDLRSPDEPIRHKLLDAVGDLALVGLPVRGRLEVHRGSHALHHALLCALIAVPTAWTKAT